MRTRGEKENEERGGRARQLGGGCAPIESGSPPSLSEGTAASPTVPPCRTNQASSRCAPIRCRAGSPARKFGIFIHWGVFSVPAWAPTSGTMFDQQDPFRNTPYTEWYLNSLALEGSPVQAHHRDTYGESTTPTTRSRRSSRKRSEGGIRRIWADLFAAAGARYVVLVTKHHDGFLLWPSAHPNPFKEGWHSERDLVGELGDAVRARGLTYGLYYSGGLDWTFGGAGIDSFRVDGQGDPADRGVRAVRRRALARADRALPAGRALERHRLSDGGRFPAALRRLLQRACPTVSSTTASTSSGVSGGTAHADFTTPEYATMDRDHRGEVGDVPRHRPLVRAEPQRTRRGSADRRRRSCTCCSTS